MNRIRTQFFPRRAQSGERAHASCARLSRMMGAGPHRVTCAVARPDRARTQNGPWRGCVPHHVKLGEAEFLLVVRLVDVPDVGVGRRQSQRSHENCHEHQQRCEPWLRQPPRRARSDGAWRESSLRLNRLTPRGSRSHHQGEGGIRRREQKLEAGEQQRSVFLLPAWR